MKRIKNIQAGYELGLQDALKVIQNILQHNDILLKESEFWREYRMLVAEGEIKDDHTLQ